MGRVSFDPSTGSGLRMKEGPVPGNAAAFYLKTPHVLPLWKRGMEGDLPIGNL
jgi:hypothetical protein